MVLDLRKFGKNMCLCQFLIEFLIEIKSGEIGKLSWDILVNACRILHTLFDYSFAHKYLHASLVYLV